MKILALEYQNSHATADGFKQHAHAEAQKVWDLTQAGIIRESYFRADRNEAVLVLECETIYDAEAVLSTLPMVQAGLIKFDLIPLKPYPGFERLFAKTGVPQPGNSSQGISHP